MTGYQRRIRCHTSGRAHLDKVGGFWEGGTLAFDSVGVATSDLTGPPRSTTSSDPLNLVRRAASACSRATVLSANRSKIGGSLDEDSAELKETPGTAGTGAGSVILKSFLNGLRSHALYINHNILT